jgi:hypothetical protein
VLRQRLFSSIDNRRSPTPVLPKLTELGAGQETLRLEKCSVSGESGILAEMVNGSGISAAAAAAAG